MRGELDVSFLLCSIFIIAVCIMYYYSLIYIIVLCKLGYSWICITNHLPFQNGGFGGGFDNFKLNIVYVPVGFPLCQLNYNTCLICSMLVHDIQEQPSCGMSVTRLICPIHRLHFFVYSIHHPARWLQERLYVVLAYIVFVWSTSQVSAYMSAACHPYVTMCHTFHRGRLFIFTLYYLVSIPY